MLKPSPTLTPSCPHPMNEPVAISMAVSTSQRLAITGYSLRHAPTEHHFGTFFNHAWMRTFDRDGGQIPPADYRTRLSSFNGRPQRDENGTRSWPHAEVRAMRANRNAA